MFLGAMASRLGQSVKVADVTLWEGSETVPFTATFRGSLVPSSLRPHSQVGTSMFADVIRLSDNRPISQGMHASEVQVNAHTKASA